MTEKKYRKLSELPHETITLRRVSIEHQETLYKLITQPGVLENLTIEIENETDFRRYIHYIQSQWSLNQDFTYTIILNETEEIIGQTSIYNISFLHHRGELGIWLGPEYWKNGYAQASLKTLIRYGFTNFHLNRLQAHIFTTNEASIKLFKRLGFSFEGIIREYVRKDSHYQDVQLYSQLNREFAKEPAEFEEN